MRVLKSLLFIACFLILSQTLVSQSSVLDKKVSINVEDILIKDAIELLGKKANVEFTFGNAILNEKEKANINIKDRPLGEVLDELLKNRNIGYKLMENRIVLFHQKPTTGQLPNNIEKKSSKYTVSGYLKDATTGEALIGAHIFDANSRDGTSTNVYGFYSLTLPEGAVELHFSYIGYEEKTETFFLEKDLRLTMEIAPSGQLAEVVVTASEYTEKLEEQTLMSTVALDMKEVKMMPVIGGEVDVLKTLQLLPGVQSGNEGFSGIYVRGGGPDQNLILLDGVPVYNPSHLFGLFSVFNADAINKVELIKGGFPARHGGRLSSILDIRMKEGNNKKWTGQTSIGLIASKFTLEGPLIKDRLSVMVSARRTYADLFVRPIVKKNRKENGEGGDLGFYFVDFNAKVNYRLSEKDNIYLSFYNGKDNFFDRLESTKETGTGNDKSTLFKLDRSALAWGNTIAALRWNHLYGNKLFSNATINYTRYQFEVITEKFQRREGANIENREVLEFFKYNTDVRDVTAKIDFDYLPSARHSIKFGIGVVRHDFLPGVTALKDKDTEIKVNRDTTFGGQNLLANKYTAYIEDDIKITDKWSINAGLHTFLFSVAGTNYSSIEPRLISNFQFLPTWSFKASYTRMNQQLHLLSNSGIGLPTDLWVLPTANVKPQKSWQAAGGIAHTFPQGIELSVEGYYKKMDNLIAYKEGASFLLDGSSWENKVTQGEGWSYGSEFFLRKKRGQTTGWLGYTLSWTNRRFDEINFGKKYPFKFDRRHDLALFVAHRFSDRLSVSSNWVYGTGSALSLPIREFDRLNNTVTGGLNDYGSKNSFRLRPYHRLDFSISYFKKGKRGDHTFNLSIYNAYNRRNPYYITTDFAEFDEGDTRNDVEVFKEVSLLPIIPSLRWDFKF